MKCDNDGDIVYTQEEGRVREYIRLFSFLAENGKAYMATVPADNPHSVDGDLVLSFFRTTVFDGKSFVYPITELEEYFYVVSQYNSVIENMEVDPDLLMLVGDNI